MFSLFDSLKSVLKGKSIQIESRIWQLHNKATVILLVACSIVVTSKQYIGDPINCLVSTKDEIPERVIDTYCWIHTTFTLPNSLSGRVGVDVAHPGVDKSVPEQPKRYHTYYQWVCFVLFFQAVLFYLPRYLWKVMEKGRIENLMLGLNSPLVSEEESQKRRNLLVEYLTQSRKSHRHYMIGFFLCEFLYLVNVTLQIWLMDSFLDGEFSRYGIEVIKFTVTEQENRLDPMVRVFPRVTKCTFHKFGPSGDLMKHDVLCLLPLNIVNEKTYVFLWFWFVVLSALTGLWILLRIPVICSRKVRRKVLSISIPGGTVVERNIETIVNDVDLGDWVLLYLLEKNISGSQFRQVLAGFADDIKNVKQKTKYESA